MVGLNFVFPNLRQVYVRWILGFAPDLEKKSDVSLRVAQGWLRDGSAGGSLYTGAINQ